jgi:hypothetical protein
MRTFRFGRQVDVVTCLGNSLAYVHQPDDLAAVFATFAAHARPGTVIVIRTQTTPIRTRPKTHRVDTADLRGRVTISYDWDEQRQINTMYRLWELADGTRSEDRIRRRVMSMDEIQTHLARAGFEVRVEAAGRSGPSCGPIGPNGFVVARHGIPA